MRKVFWMMVVVLVAALALTACGGGDEPAATEAPAAAAQAPAAPAGDAKNGGTLYAQTCVACHGQKGEGVTGLGKPFTTSEFMTGLDDAGLVAFVMKGRDTSDPLNTTGVAMPPKGGNPALTEQQVYDIVAFVRTLHQ